MKIAVVGAGISGLLTAYLLAPGHDITVYEADSHAGGHTNTIAVELDGEHHQVDTGFIVFNDRNYPHFERLLGRLGVGWQPSNMSFGVSDEHGRFEYAARSLNSLFATRRNALRPGFYRMIAEVPRFQRACRALLDDGDDNPSLRAWLIRERFSEPFVERLIVPQVAAVWSTDPEQLWSFPARFLAQFFANHGMLELRGRPRWRVVAGGSARYVEALTAGFRDRIHLNTPVRSVKRDRDSVHVRTDAGEERFDEVVIATHSDQALRLLADPTPAERSVLGAIRYAPNEAVLHTDTRVMPRRRAAWASWNYHLLERTPEHTTVTYDMNRLQSLRSKHRFLVTLGLSDRIAPDRIIGRYAYAHPVYTAEAVAAQARVGEISGVGRTHYCGAYWGWGFHEDGVNSALRVAASFGASL